MHNFVINSTNIELCPFVWASYIL